MKRRTSYTKSMLTITLAITTLLSSNASMAIAASTPTFSQSEVAQLGKYEQSLFGQQHTSLSNESRLRAIETNLFGKYKSGSVKSRLEGIDKLIGSAKSDQYLMPPMAPLYDRGSAPEPASGYASPSYDSEPAPVAQGLLDQAMSLYSQGKTAEAESAFKRVLASDSKSVDAYFNLGVIAESRGDNQEALKNYEAAYRLNPSDFEIKSARDSLKDKIANDQRIAAKQEADRRAQQAKESQTQDLKKMVAQASADYKSGNVDKAIDTLTKVSRQVPKDADVHYALAQALRAKGDANGARSELSQALSLDPNNQLYLTARAEMDKQAQQQIADRNAPPAGEITPFAGGKDSSRGFDSYASNDSYGSSSGYEYQRPSTSLMSNSRLKRAVMGGVAGAAAGALSGIGRGSVKSNAVKGALVGGVLGFMLGR